jgi:uncharacterized protein YbaP (TraB family)
MIRTMRRKLLSATLVLFMAAWPLHAEPAMWVIKDSDSTIYLIGTLHLLKHDSEWKSEKVKKTVGESTELWLEVADLENQTELQLLIAKHGMDLGKPLSKKLNPPQRKKLAKIAATYGIPAARLEPMQPWLAAVLLGTMPLVKAGYDPKAGIDRLLKTQAVAEGDQIRGFETAEAQVRIMADLPQAVQVTFLAETLDDVEEGLGLLDKIAQAWIDGDTETIARLGVTDMKREAPEAYKKLLVDRNVAWSEKIVEILKGSGVVQIAVGAGHLAGPDSVQALLEKKGIKVELY